MKKLKHFLFLIAFFLFCIVIAMTGVYFIAKKQLNESNEYINQRQVQFALKTLDQKSKEVEMMATSLAYSDRVRYLSSKQTIEDIDSYDRLIDVKTIKQKLENLINDSIGVKSISIYWPSMQLMVSTLPSREAMKSNWLINSKEFGRGWKNNEATLSFSISYPYIKQREASPEFFIGIELEERYLIEVTESASTSFNSHNLLVLPDGKMFKKDGDSSFEKNYLSKKVAKQKNVLIDEKVYQMLSLKSDFNQLSIVSYYDNAEFLQTISRITLVTTLLTTVVIILGCILMIIFYRNVLFQFDILLKNFKQVENGNLGTRIDYESKNEFGYVFNQFNQMVKGIQQLLDSFKNEHEKRGVAENKQLQSQINPHFLYNSLFYIVSVSENPKAVRQMSKHLADYYRYSTISQELVLLEDEVNFATSYLKIMSLRKSLFYTINIDEESKNQYILPLLLQPLIENAIYHGIEGRYHANQVAITIKSYKLTTKITVEDDGKGLDDQEIQQLLMKISEPQNKKDTIGLWNCNQRLKNYYGLESKIIIEHSSLLGGLCVGFEIRGDSINESIHH